MGFFYWTWWRVLLHRVIAKQQSKREKTNPVCLKAVGIVCIGVSTPLKNTPSIFVARLPLNWQTVQAPLFRQSLPLYWFFMNPRKIQIFQWTTKILKFFIFNTILSFKSN